MTSKAIARMVPINGNKHEEFYAATLSKVGSYFKGTEMNGEAYNCFRGYWKVEMLPVEWNGEGLPPVGTECERSWTGDKWLTCRVLFIGDENIVLKLATREVSYLILDVKFRPIRSARDKAVEAMFYAIPKDLRVGIDCRQSIYDAIAAGKIPGVKLDN